MKLNRTILKNLTLNITDGEHGSVIDDENGKYYLLSNKNIINGKISYNNSDRKISSLSFEKINRRTKLKKGDVVISTVGTIGKSAIISEDNLCYDFQRSVGIIKCDETKLLPDYLNYYFKQDFVQTRLNYLSKGAVQKCLFIGDLNSFEIDYPKDIKIQKGITDILVTIDSKIELNNKINAELEAMAKTIYDYWFVQFDFPNAKGKPYKSSGGKMVWNEELKREIPVGWEVKELGDVINIFDSKRIPLSKQQRENRKGNIPYYGATGVMDFVDEALFDDEFILIAEDGSVMDENGLLIVQFIWGKSWVNNHAHVIQAKEKRHNEYVFYLSKKIQAVQIITGSIQLKINQENLKGVKLPFPPKNILDSFCSQADSIRKTLINNIEQNQQLASLRDWLLPMLMNGQVKVGDAEKMVEEKLNMAAEAREDYSNHKASKENGKKVKSKTLKLKALNNFKQ
ncbi:MAG: restriction endonuclease subunit S [Bacteroidia bacterium]